MTGTYRTTADLAETRAIVRDAAVAQGHVFRREDLVRWHLDPFIAPVMLRRRWWVRLRHGVYVDHDILLATADVPARRHDIDLAALMLTLSEPAFAFGRSAASVHDLPLPVGSVDVLTIVRPSRKDLRAGLPRLRSSAGLPAVKMLTHELTDDLVANVRGVPTVVRPLAAFSAAASLSHEWALAVLDAGAWESPDNLAAYSSWLSDWPVLRGIGTLRRAVPLARVGAQSPLESLSRLRLMSEGLAEPVLQHPFVDNDGLIGYADMYFAQLGVIGECDGLAKYQTREDLIAEKLREDRLRALGFGVVRWTWSDIMRNPARIARRIVAAEGRSRRRAG